METFDARWHLILTEALCIRAGDDGPSAYSDLALRRRDTRDLLATVIGWYAA